MHAQGFSLIELAIIITVLGILALWISIDWPVSTINLSAQADQLMSDLRYTQSLSMSKGERYQWVMTASNAYQMVDSNGLPLLLANGQTKITLTSGITFGTLINLPQQLLAFDGHGIPYITSGRPGTALANTALIPLVAAGQMATVTITPQTGRVTKQ